MFNRFWPIRYQQPIEGTRFYPRSVKEACPPIKSGGIVIGSSVTPTTPAPEEGGFDFRDDDYIPLSTSVSTIELTEEEQLPIALKTSKDTTLEE